METSKSNLRGLPRNLWVVTATSFLTDISSEMIFNLIPLFLANVLKAGTAAIGLIDGLAETTASLTKMYSGALSDRLGTRKWITVVGYGLSACAKPFLYFADAWGWVLAVRVSDRLGKGIRTAPRDALVADSIDEERRGLAFGLHRAGDTAGAFIGVLAAAAIVWMTERNAVDLTRRTFQIAVLVSILPAILAVLILAFGAQDTGIRSKSKVPILSMKGMDRRFKLFMLALALFSLGNSSDAFIILLGQNRGLTVLQVMLMMMSFNLVYTILAGPLGAASDKIGRRKLILYGWIAYGLVYLGFAASKTGWHVWILFGLYGIYYAATEGSTKAFIADLVAPEQRGKAYGISNAVIGLMAFPASVIAGLLWQGAFAWSGFGHPAPFLFGAGMAILAGILFWKMAPAQR
ncbi:MAG TPA: MFS transporter [Acidobacteriota bacterium]|nr:MFS transporter [Acidobacteriota bacterium]